MQIANGMEFVDDEAVIGKWENIGWTACGDAFSVANLHEKSGDFSLLYFLPNGEPYWIF